MEAKKCDICEAETTYRYTLNDKTRACRKCMIKMAQERYGEIQAFKAEEEKKAKLIEKIKENENGEVQT